MINAAVDITSCTRALFETQNRGFVSHNRHVCCVTQQKCLLCHTADMSAVSRSKHVCYATQQTCLLCHTAGMSVASHSRRVCRVTQLDSPPQSNYFVSCVRELRRRAVRCCSHPTERSEACLERSFEVRDCTLHITQTKARTWHRLRPARETY